ncbi:(E2-independent) E3 ubiquitin-conjugating enzyme FATS isoform X5 [Marmota marmota marmota]|uniref:(E2-independent) E3 ubiquitin-conjugating enzyme FATS isoform X5 n=1 Tax=Marmota marmota marmota TaxID=9994 RepID=UPI00209399E9|nr:(E2-independent) E3 ubiquitin-conjugating enzyme FATS isoform X5 [Marmota marmota marmota]
MLHSGTPSTSPREGLAAGHAGTAADQTFQIKTFSTELKNHVMVMDFVKSNWFPSQRRAKVCIIHLCQGLKTAQQPASRYEIHSRVFSSPKDQSSRERGESLLNAGPRDNHCSPNNPIALRNLQSDVLERKPDFPKEALATQNSKMISSIVISQLIDENKPREPGAALPLPCAIAQPRACPTKPASTNRSRVSIHRALALLPGKLGVHRRSDERGSEAELLPAADRGLRKGFASITITARRVRPAASALVWGTVGESPCPRCRAEDALLGVPSAGPQPHQHHGPFDCAECPRNGSLMRLKVPEARAGLCAGNEYWVTHVDHKESRFSADPPPSGKTPLAFSSCVHLQMSRQCQNSIYYLDKSLSVPVEQPQIASPKVHRSVLSLNLSCSSHGLTADGVDGPANGEPMSSCLRQELAEGNLDLQSPHWSPALQESHSKENLSLGRVHLGTGTCPWSSSPLSENIELADVGTNLDTVRKGKEDHADPCTSSHAEQLAIHIPGWSYKAGDYTCCDLVVKIKECKKSEEPTVPEPSPEPPSPAAPQGAETFNLSEEGSELEQTPANSLTLQEALEAHRPQFISRSQERLRKLERMVQQRKAQQTEHPEQKPSRLPVRANKKQFTVPHPLSESIITCQKLKRRKKSKRKGLSYRATDSELKSSKSNYWTSSFKGTQSDLGCPADHNLDLGRLQTLDKPLNLALPSQHENTYFTFDFFFFHKGKNHFLNDPNKQHA